MAHVTITREDFLKDRQGRTFVDVLNDSGQPFAEVLEFFNNADRQRRMEESEAHHDRAPMAGVVRELESLPAINKFLGTVQAQRNQRLRQAIGVLVRMIMEARGWKKTGKKGSLGVRSSKSSGTPSHNTGGLAFWFLRAERYENEQAKKFPSVRKRCRELESTGSKKSAATKSATPKRATSKGQSAKGQSGKAQSADPHSTNGRSTNGRVTKRPDSDRRPTRRPGAN
ncbi:MAG TPA: hypothetical protein VGI40_17490 [Pirellulaceae bacterium]